MKYVNKFAILPNDLSYAVTLNYAASILEEKLVALDYQSLDISEYGKRYYEFDLRKITYMLQSYVFMLLWSQNKTKKKLNDITLLDHGGGIGILSMLAKLAGIKTVIHQDINPTISNDAFIISKKLDIEIDYFITGTTKDFVTFVNTNNLNLNIVGSRNVIEHVYNVNQFFEETSNIKTDKLILFISTTANEKNPLVNYYTKNLQQSYEYKGSPIVWGSKEIDPKKSGLTERKRIITTNFDGLTQNEITLLTKLTRGLDKVDILNACKDYQATKTLPTLLKHATNTCVPETGSWVEQLIPLNDYKKMVEVNNFTFDFKNGFYNTNYQQKYLNIVTPFLNYIIKKLGNKGTFLSPFISIIAER